MACGLMKKGGVLNYNISLFLSLENNFGDLGAEEGEQGGSLLVFVFSNVGIIIKLMGFFLWKCVMVSVLSDGAIFISLIASDGYRVSELGFSGILPGIISQKMGFWKGKFNKAIAIHHFIAKFLAYLMTFQSFSAPLAHAPLSKNHQICQNIWAKNEEKPCFNLPFKAISPSLSLFQNPKHFRIPDPSLLITEKKIYKKDMHSQITSWRLRHHKTLNFTKYGNLSFLLFFKKYLIFFVSFSSFYI